MAGYFAIDGERTGFDRLAEDMSTTSTGEPSPSRRLSSAPAWLTTSSAIFWASETVDALAETVTLSVPFSWLAVRVLASWAGVVLRARESTTLWATASEVKTGTTASTFWLASWEAVK